MTNMKSAMRLYAVTDRHWLGEHTLCQQVEAALQGGVTCVQLREKHLPDQELLALAKDLAPLCRRYGVPFIVNDRPDIALAVGADGVHLGQEDLQIAKARAAVGNRLLIGASAHTVEEALEARRQGADYLGVGAVFATGTKTNVTEMPRETLRAICRAVDIPVVAIGGITKDNLHLLSGTGIDGIAVVSAIFAQPDCRAAAEELLETMEGANL